MFPISAGMVTDSRYVSTRAVTVPVITHVAVRYVAISRLALATGPKAMILSIDELTVTLI